MASRRFIATIFSSVISLFHLCVVPVHAVYEPHVVSQQKAPPSGDSTNEKRPKPGAQAKVHKTTPKPGESMEATTKPEKSVKPEKEKHGGDGDKYKPFLAPLE